MVLIPNEAYIKSKKDIILLFLKIWINNVFWIFSNSLYVHLSIRRHGWTRIVNKCFFMYIKLRFDKDAILGLPFRILYPASTRNSYSKLLTLLFIAREVIFVRHISFLEIPSFTAGTHPQSMLYYIYYYLKIIIKCNKKSKTPTNKAV